MLSERKWKLESVLRLLMGLLVCYGVGMLLAQLLRGASDPKAVPTVGRVVVNALIFQFVLLAMIWRFLREQNVSWSDGFGLARSRVNAIGLGALAVGLFLPIAALMQGGALSLMKHFNIEAPMQLALQALLNSSSPAAIAVLGVITVVIAPIAEETLFRGILYPTIKQHGFPRAALWGTSVLFALIHCNLAVFLPLLMMALLLVWLYEKTDNLLAPVTAHVIFNAVNFGRAVYLIVHDHAHHLPAQP